MRKRDLRALRTQHNRERWQDLYAPAIDVQQVESCADELEAKADEAWHDAIAGADDTPASVDAAGTYTD